MGLEESSLGKHVYVIVHSDLKLDLTLGLDTVSDLDVESELEKVWGGIR